MRFGSQTLIRLAIVFCLALLARVCLADEAADYAKHISAARSALAAGKMDEASSEADEAIKLSPTRFEAFVLRYSVQSKRGDAKGAEAALVEAQKLAPEAKRKAIGDLLDQLRKQAAGAAPTPGPGPATAPAEPPLTPKDRYALIKLQNLLDEAKTAASPEAERAVFERLLTETGEFLDTHPKNERVWALRAMTALKLDRAVEGGQAAEALQKLGILDHGDEATLKLLAKIDEKGWIAIYRDAKAHPDRSMTNSIGMKLVRIPPGEFLMGSPETEEGRYDNEKQHKVTLTRGFMMAATPVTQGQWKAIVGSTVAEQRDKANKNFNFILVGEADDLPMYYVSWDEANEFCQKLSAKEGRKYRLPTEAEWEYACRAGATGAYGGSGVLDEMGWYADNSGDERINSTDIWENDKASYGKRVEDNHCHPHSVGQKKRNAFGLYDMHGNVGQWCSDYSGDYPAGAVTDPAGLEQGSSRVLRGGAWNGLPRVCRCANRNWFAPDSRYHGVGFRVCLDL
jgi:formylglycine-generating enzyme required for sulfatase activity